MGNSVPRTNNLSQAAQQINPNIFGNLEGGTPPASATTPRGSGPIVRPTGPREAAPQNGDRGSSSVIGVG